MTRLTITATCNYRHNDVPFICFRSNAEESALINNLRVEPLIGGCVPQLLCECPSLCAEGTISRCRQGAMLRCDSGSEDQRDGGGVFRGGDWPLSFGTAGRQHVAFTWLRVLFARGEKKKISWSDVSFTTLSL